jgi:hypothetical protein
MPINFDVIFYSKFTVSFKAPQAKIFWGVKISPILAEGIKWGGWGGYHPPTSRGGTHPPRSQEPPSPHPFIFQD